MPRKDIEADGLTAETMRENFRLRQENELLRKECRLLAAKADGRKRPNTEMVKALLAEAERSIATGSKIVERQRCIIKELERDGHDTSQARSVLHELLNTQSLHVLTRDRLLGSINRVTCALRVLSLGGSSLFRMMPLRLQLIRGASFALSRGHRLLMWRQSFAFQAGTSRI